MPTTPNTARPRPSTMAAVGCWLLGVAATALSVQTVLESFETAGQFFSAAGYENVVTKLGGKIATAPNGTITADVDLMPIVLSLGAVALVTWLCGALVLAYLSRQRYTDALARWGAYGWIWWLLPGLWELLRLASFAAGLVNFAAVLLASVGLWYAVALAGWLATFFTLFSQRADASTLEPSLRVDDNSKVPLRVWAAMAIYAVVFTAMNWQLYRGLLVPHGDSAMYEEHLWNLEHGKGFRSYLDRGLFLGEHVQVIHVLLIPLHLIWPSQLLLEACQSIALASGAIPAFWIARRHTASPMSAALFAIAYLLYFPMHFLDISIDLKTFRPESFGVPALLFALDQLERKRYAAFAILLALAISSQEAFTFVVAPLGLWIAIKAAHSIPQTAATSVWRARLLGLALAVCATAYFLFVVTVVLPWFRGGVETHYVSYLSKYGSSAREVIETMMTQPGLLLGDLLNARTLLYALSALLPLSLTPLLSPGRLAVALPIFVLLCLNELTQGDVYPRHHFHAPLAPIVVWAAAAGLGNLPRLLARLRWSEQWATVWVPRFVMASALSTGLLFSIGPTGLQFWDAGSDYCWKKLYVPGKRAEMFARIDGKIPRNSRVASTDFVHPRFTHCDRSYDYSEYPRAVNDFKPGAPADTDFIVIDTQHRYSKIKSPDQIPELRDHPADWELWPDTTEGYFIVVERKSTSHGNTHE